jgi:hypothetical protein
MLTAYSWTGRLPVGWCRNAAYAGAAVALTGCGTPAPRTTGLIDQGQAIETKQHQAAYDPEMGRVRLRVLGGSENADDIFNQHAVRQAVQVLATYQNFAVLDPENLEAIRQEWELVDAGVVDPSQVPSPPGLSFPEYHVRFQVVQAETDVQVDRAAAKWEFFIPVGMKRDDRVGVVELIVDIVAPLSGETVGSVRTAAVFTAQMRGNQMSLPVGVGVIHSESERSSRVPPVQAVRAAVEQSAPKIFDYIRLHRRGN